MRDFFGDSPLLFLCLQSELIKRTRLKERGCVWEFGAACNSVILPRVDQFFKAIFNKLISNLQKETEKLIFSPTNQLSLPPF